LQQQQQQQQQQLLRSALYDGALVPRTELLRWMR